MKFEIGKREIDVKWGHVLLFLGVEIGLTITMMVLSAAIAYMMPEGPWVESFFIYNIWIGGILAVISQPLLGWVFLSLAEPLKMKKDVGFCRGIATAQFLVITAIWLLVMVIETIFFITHMGPGAEFLPPAYNIAFTLGYLVSAALGAIVQYLWMLLLLNPNKRKLTDAAFYAVIFALLMALLDASIAFAMTYYPGMAFQLSLDIEMARYLAIEFMFGLPLIYYLKGMKKLDDGAQIFVALYVGAKALYLIANMEWITLGNVVEIIALIESLLGLVLVYLLSRLEIKDATL